MGMRVELAPLRNAMHCDAMRCSAFICLACDVRTGQHTAVCTHTRCRNTPCRCVRALHAFGDGKKAVLLFFNCFLAAQYPSSRLHSYNSPSPHQSAPLRERRGHRSSVPPHTKPIKHQA